MSKFKVMVVEPNKEPYIKEIVNTADSDGVKSLVGGMIQYMPLEDDDVNLICDEEGKLRNLEFNRILGDDFIAGTFIITGVNESAGVLCSIPENKIQKYMNIFKLDKHKKIVDYIKSEYIRSRDFYNMQSILFNKYNINKDKIEVRKKDS